jgi:beta-mannosidase
MTVGPYRPITLHTYTARIADAHARAHVDHALRPALGLDLLLRGAVAAAVASVRVVLRDAKGGTVREEEVDVRARVAAGQLANADEDVEVQNVLQWDLAGAVELWWPVGSGAQPLYDVQITLLAVVSPSFSLTSFRDAELARRTAQSWTRRRSALASAASG